MNITEPSLHFSLHQQISFYGLKQAERGNNCRSLLFIVFISEINETQLIIFFCQKLFSLICVAYFTNYAADDVKIARKKNHIKMT